MTHYFATHAMGYAKAATQEEAIEKLLLSHHTDPSWVRNCLKAGEPLVVFTCRVDADIDASYKVEWFAPKGVDTAEGRNWLVVYLTKTKYAVTQDFTQEVKRYEQAMQTIADGISEFQGQENQGDIDDAWQVMNAIEDIALQHGAVHKDDVEEAA